MIDALSILHNSRAEERVYYSGSGSLLHLGYSIILNSTYHIPFHQRLIHKEDVLFLNIIFFDDQYI